LCTVSRADLELITHSRKPGSNSFNCLIDIRIKSASGGLLDSSLAIARRPQLAGSKGRQESEHCVRVNAPAGVIRFLNDAINRDPGELDAYAPEAPQLDVRETPVETLSFLLPSRYCDGDTELLDLAWRTFGQTPTGWPRVQAICDFVHAHLRFDYQAARANRTGLDAFRERVGVCRDFTRLAITLCRCLNIPARYATGYLGDIGVPAVPRSDGFWRLVRSLSVRTLAHLRRAT
jgi:transglutaminase-like putative cysteine protease